MPAAANIKLWLSVQFVLARLKKAKEDLLQGKNEAPKLEQTQVDALEKLVDVLSPPSVDVIESSAEKVQLLLEGNKREFGNSGFSYSVLKETLIMLAASPYFSGDASADREEAKMESEPASVTEALPKVSNEKPQERVVESKKSPQQRVPHPAPVQHVNQQQQQPLCFKSDQIADNDLPKDSAVVAVAPSGCAYPQMAALSGPPILNIKSHFKFDGLMPGQNARQMQQQHASEANLDLFNVSPIPPAVDGGNSILPLMCPHCYKQFTLEDLGSV